MCEARNGRNTLDAKFARVCGRRMFFDARGNWKERVWGRRIAWDTNGSLDARL